MISLQDIDAEIAKRQQGSQSAVSAPAQFSLDDIDREIARREEYRRLSRQQAEEMSGLQKFGTSIGRGFYNIGRGVGLVDKATEEENLAYEQLRETAPKTTMIGEVVGETAPFAPLGVGLGAVKSLGARAAGAFGLGAAETGISARGREESIGEQVAKAGAGGAIASGLELGLPYIGRIGGAFIRRVKGRAPTGAVVDEAGRPSAELIDALQEQGLTYEDLISEARQQLSQARNVDVEQASRQALFKQEQIPASTGDITQKFENQAVEQRLLQSAYDPVAEEFRQFRLSQSEAIKENLKKILPFDDGGADTGNIIAEALSGRKSLLRSTKNDLYKQAGDQAKDLGGLPLFTDDIKKIIPDAADMEDLAITAPQSMKSIDQLLMQYGLKDPTEDMIQKGFTPRQLSVDNFERFRKSLNAIQRGDQTGAAKVVTEPLKRAIDEELVNLAENVGAKQLPDELIGALKQARQTTAQIKKEFSPQSFVGKLIDVKKDGVTPIIESSQVYSKIASKAQPVENVKKLMVSLRQSGDKGKAGIKSLQQSVLLDFIDAGFSTQSRKVDGIPIFNPTSFKKRVKSLGDEKLKEIFKDEPKILAKIKNIDKIAESLVPAGGAVPKGSAPIIMDALERLGMLSITQKIPGSSAFIEGFKQLSKSNQTREQVKKAIEGSPELVKVIEQQYSGIAKALPVLSRTIAPAAAVGVTTDRNEQQ